MKTNGLLEFLQRFPDEASCKRHLYAQKWSRGYQCGRCGHHDYGKGATLYHRRCLRCFYDESCTAQTLFHKIKFPLQKAFAIVYQLSTMKKGLSSCEIARQFGIHQETAWYFKQKVMRAMAEYSALLVSSVEVDETTIGGFEKGKPGRSHGKRQIIQVAVEIEYSQDDEQPMLKNARAMPINDNSTEELKRAINVMISEDALITTDGNSSYRKAADPRMHVAWLSEKGRNFQKLHWHIFNLKNWIRGIHHHISPKYAQFYLDEFHFRFNTRNLIADCFQKVIYKMTKLPWMPYKRMIAG